MRRVAVVMRGRLREPSVGCFSLQQTGLLHRELCALCDLTSAAVFASLQVKGRAAHVWMWHILSLPISEVDTPVYEGAGDQQLRLGKPSARSAGGPYRMGTPENAQLCRSRWSRIGMLNMAEGVI